MQPDAPCYLNAWVLKVNHNKIEIYFVTIPYKQMPEKKKHIKVAMADDHTLLCNALANLINGFDGFKVVHQASNGKQLTDYILAGAPVDVVLLDLNMPVMDGFATADWLRKNAPDIHVLMLTMYDSELVLIKLLQQGVKGFLKKDIHPTELKFAIESVIQSGFYYSNNSTGKIVNLFRNHNERSSNLQKALLDDHEIRFLQLASSDMTYKEIAIELGLNPRSVDNLRDRMFEKLDVKSRVGLAMYAIKNGLVRF
jgi:DNA-binding NarL/FixJ family response regulator